ncbi:MAG: type II secretion system protein [Gammaproteobacteria bacterium]|nr:type II secretion system protein [Gammaproteobacteria bacterium]MBP9728751.1 type II secretion system protein [Gammaproteobacteria bacterium]
MRRLGFTLIELVIVIVILGVLAAAALPRFANLREQAIVSANRSFAGGLRSSSNIMHAAWIASGAPNADVNPIIVEGIGDLKVNNSCTTAPILPIQRMALFTIM